MKKIKVSVIIAVYNIERYIERCILSVINQSLKEIEIIVVNDGSNDNSSIIINNLSKKDPRIKVINKKNEGLVEARKSGMNIANGEYLLFIDGDDWIEKECLYKLYKSAYKNNSDIVQFNAYKSYDDRKYHLNMFNRDKYNTCRSLDSIFLDYIRPNIWSKLVKHDFIKSKNIIFPENLSYGEDLAISTVLFMHEPKISFVDEPLYNYYQRETSITNVVNKRILEVDNVIIYIKDYLIKLSLYEKYKDEFDFMVFLHLFIYRILEARNLTDIHKLVYMKYKAKKINEKNNKYIQRYIKESSIYLKMKIKIYLKGYKYCKIWNRIVNLVKYNNITKINKI